jgi:S-adenosylmethionine synthetase
MSCHTTVSVRPDAKSQVYCVYQDGRVVGDDAEDLSTQHDGDISQATIGMMYLNIFSKSTKKVARQTLMFYVIKKLNSKRF